MDELAIGHVEWHSSDEGGGPDVGVLLHISTTDSLWIGEITSKEGADFGVPDTGWHIVHHHVEGKTHVGSVPDRQPAIDLAEALSAAIRASVSRGERHG